MNQSGRGKALTSSIAKREFRLLRLASIEPSEKPVDIVAHPQIADLQLLKDENGRAIPPHASVRRATAEQRLALVTVKSEFPHGVAALFDKREDIRRVLVERAGYPVMPIAVPRGSFALRSPTSAGRNAPTPRPNLRPDALASSS